MDAWKKSLAAGKEKKQKETEGAAGTRSLLDEIDKRAAIQAATPVTSSPVSAPAVEDSAAKEPPTEDATVKESSPVPYAGKFDPKAIAKKVASSHTASKLGTDLVVPGKVKASAASNSTQNGLKANDSKATAKSTSSKSVAIEDWEVTSDSLVPDPAPKGTTKARGHVSGFGLAAKSHTEPEKSSNKRGLDLDEEEGSRKKLEKLPTPPPENGAMNEDAALANGTKDEDADDDEDADLQDAGTEEEAAAAARAAAEKREERLQAQSLAYQTGEANAQVNGDTEMTDAPQIPDTTPMEVVEEQEEQEEIDPLDAFMTDLGDPMAHPSKGKSFKKTKPKAQEAEALFGDDDATDLKAVEADPDDILSMASKRKKKDLPAVNHAKISYDPFRKAFYHEPLELANMTEEEVAELRLELDGIKVRGIDVPKPVQKWSQCGLGVQTLNVIHNVLKYEKPSPIQMQACPAIMAGRDVIGVAKTGSGKTIAFLLPMFRHIKDQRPLDMLEGPIALIMTPTRELATQIHKECKHFLKALNLRAVCAYGGAPIKDQIADLKRGAEIIVATPGRFIDLLAANGGRVTNLRRVTYIVLDESDRLWDMGFEPQISRILQNIRPDRQTVLFSATFPRTIEALARKALSKPVEIVVGGRSVVASEITQIVHVLPEESKFVRLLELLGNLYSDEKNEDDRALIFVNQQSSCDTLLRDLMRKGYPCLSLHGGKDQIERDDAISDFKAGVVPIMIATSVAARGLDVKQLTLVINYDPPNHYEDLVHRAGRTGRAGAKGTAVTFLTEDQERYSIDIAKALKQSGQEVPEDVQKLVTQFTEKVKAGKEKASGSGFGGKGLERLDQERDAARNRERKTYKTGEEGEDEDKDEKDAGDDLVAKAASTVQPASGGSSLMPAPASAQLPGVPKGIDLDGKITVHKTEVPSSGGAKNPLDKVSAAVASINTRLSNTGVLRQGVPIDNKGPDAGAFHATLEINDFPRKLLSSPTLNPYLNLIVVYLGIEQKLTPYRKSPLGRHQPHQRRQDPRSYRDIDHDEGQLLWRGQRTAGR